MRSQGTTTTKTASNPYKSVRLWVEGGGATLTDPNRSVRITVSAAPNPTAMAAPASHAPYTSRHPPPPPTLSQKFQLVSNCLEAKDTSKINPQRRTIKAPDFEIEKASERIHQLWHYGLQSSRSIKNSQLCNEEVVFIRITNIG